jgi:MFS family permease
MVQALSSVASLLLGIALLLMGLGLFGTFIAVRMTLEGFSAEALGIVASLYYAGLMAGSLWAAGVVARAGHIRAFAAFAAVMAASVLVMALTVNVALWGGLRAVIGFCTAGLFMIAESWLNERASNETRGQIFAVYMITNYSAVGLGQPLLGLAPVDGPELFLIVAILVTLGLVPVALTRASSPAPVSVTRVSFRRLFGISPLGVVGCFAAGMISAAFYGLAPRFAHDSGFDVGLIAAFMTVTILGGLALQWPVGRLSDLFDRRQVTIAVSFATALVSLAILLAPTESVWTLTLWALVYGGLSFTIYPLSVAHANDFVDPAELVPVSAGLLLAYALGSSLGPITASSLIGFFGPPGLFIHAALISALLGCFAVFRAIRGAVIPSEDQMPFMPLTRMSPVAAELDPRGEFEADAEDEN